MRFERTCRAMVIAAAAVAMVIAVTIPAATATGTSGATRSQSAQSPQERRDPAIPMPQPVSNPGITLQSQTTFVGAGDTFTMVIDMAGATPDTRFSISLHPAVTSRIQFGQTLGAQQLGFPIQRFNGVAVSDLPAGPNGGTSISLRVPGPDSDTDPFTLLLTEPGVYPITITLDADPSSVPLVTHVVRLGVPTSDPSPGTQSDPSADEPAFSVAVVLDITDPEGTDGLAGALAAHPDVPVTVRAMAESMSALASSGPSGAATVTALAGAIGASEVVAGSWVPVDLASLVAADLDQFIARQILAGRSTLQQLLGRPVSETTWIMDASVDPQALSVLTSQGVRQVVIPEELTEPLDANQFPITLTRPFVLDAAADGSQGDSDERMPAMQTDLVLTALLESTDQPALAANRVLADLAVLAFDLDDIRRGAIVETSVGNVADGTISILLGGLRDAARGSDVIAPLLGARTIEGLFATAAAVGELNGETELVRSWSFDDPEPLGIFPEQLATIDDRTATLTGTLMPGPRASEATATVAGVEALVLTSGDRSLDTTGRTELLDKANQAIDDALAPIGVPEQGSVTMTADAGVIPITLQNGRADPVRVQLQLTSDKLDFPSGDTLELVLEPGTNRREVEVRVRASGGFPVEIQLRTADGSVQLGQGRFTVRSTAISGTGLVLSILAGVFLTGWWALHFRSARRSRQLMAVTGSGSDTAAAPDKAEPPPDHPPSPQ